jgi:hypothetical protein
MGRRAAQFVEEALGALERAPKEELRLPREL